MSSIKYTYECKVCKRIQYEWRSPDTCHKNGTCEDCGSDTKKIIDPPTVLIDGSLSGACPGAEMKWERDRNNRREKEIENVKEHGEGQECPNLRTI